MSAGIYRTFQVFGEVPSGGIGYVAKRVICWGEMDPASLRDCPDVVVTTLEER